MSQSETQPIIRLPRDIWNLIIGYRESSLEYITISSNEHGVKTTFPFDHITYIRGPYISPPHLSISLDRRNTTISVNKETQPNLYNRLLNFMDSYDLDPPIE